MNKHIFFTASVSLKAKLTLPPISHPQHPMCIHNIFISMLKRLTIKSVGQSRFNNRPGQHSNKKHTPALNLHDIFGINYKAWFCLPGI